MEPQTFRQNGLTYQASVSGLLCVKAASAPGAKDKSILWPATQATGENRQSKRSGDQASRSLTLRPAVCDPSELLPLTHAVDAEP